MIQFAREVRRAGVTVYECAIEAKNKDHKTLAKLPKATGGKNHSRVNAKSR